MVARTLLDPDRLLVQFERDGEPLVRVQAIDGEKAVLRAVTLLLAHKRLRVGDRLSIVTAPGPEDD
jgi:hypothetical protein